MKRGVLLLSLLLAACNSAYRAPVEDRGTVAGPGIFSNATAGSEYRVVAGDTLYSIAWRYGLDYRRLAAANGIGEPYLIREGQRLVLRESETTLAGTPAASGTLPPARPDGASVAIAYPATPAGSRSSLPPSRTSTPAPAAAPAPPPAASPAPSTPAVAAPATPAPTTARQPAPAAVPPIPQPAPAPRSDPRAWEWPSDGPLLRSFSQSGSGPKGIDIGGSRGDSVRAVAAGTVVYSGSGIPGYGQLLIVKHSDTYLSAYAHNDQLLVAEGVSVRQGQHIADKGSSGTNSVKLHFQIRRDGKPIDPIPLLPRR
jgi:lipoprotein NlpD